MTQEEKQLLLKDLFARLPYEVIVLVSSPHTTDPIRKKLNANLIFGFQKSVLTIKPYLRPMSSMTEDEKIEWFQMRQKHCNMSGFNEFQERADFTSESSDWLNKNGFDYRGLIPMGLALETHEDMYKMK